jgi:hypothetical protein
MPPLEPEALLYLNELDSFIGRKVFALKVEISWSLDS